MQSHEGAGRRLFILALFLLPLLFFSCAGSPSAVDDRVEVASDPNKAIYETSGKSLSPLNAMNMAKLDAIKLAVLDILGFEVELQNRPKLTDVLYTTNNPNAFIFKDEFETLRKSQSGEDYIYECKVPVNLEAVRSVLRAQGIIDGADSGRAVEVVREEMKEEEKTEEEKPEETDAAAEVSPEEQRVIDRYVDRMTYMVYFNEESAEDVFYAKMAVGMANEFLVTNTLETIDFDQIESLKKDQERVYEEETGEEISLIQWIAQKLNADVYIEIDAITSGETVASKRHYGQSQVTIKAFEASTGRLLATQNWSSPRTVSTSTQDDARINALQASVFKIMPTINDQSKAYMRKALEQGIKYELIVQDTSDSRLMSSFRRKLRNKVRDVETVSQSAEETKYFVYLIGTLEDLEDAIYDVTETLDGLEGMELVFSRGKSMTFTTGL